MEINTSIATMKKINGQSTLRMAPLEALSLPPLLDQL
jgi:hypothetical protein